MRTKKAEKKDTRRLERFGARLTPVQKELFQRAARLTGRTLSEFVMSAAQNAAEETIRKYHVLELSDRETAAFLAALEHPPRLNPRLERAIRRDADRIEMNW